MKLSRSAISAAGIWIFVALVFSQVYNFEFLNFDDNIYVYENSHVVTGLTAENIRWAFTSSHGAHWHPLSWLSHMLDCQLFGLQSGAHHLVNVFFHATNATLLFLVLNVTTGAFGASLFIALIFGVHPMRLESVAWVTERKDVLSMFFTLLSIFFYSKFARTGARAKYIISLGFFLLSLLSKPSAVVLPGLLLLLDYWPLSRIKSGKLFSSLRAVLIEKIPFILGSLACAVGAMLAQGVGGGLKSLEDYTLPDRMASALVGTLAYLGKLFFPTGQGIFYPFALYQPGVASGAFVALIITSGMAWHFRKSAPFLFFGWSWFLVALIPVIGLVQIGGQAFADRWSYLPHVGLLIATTWGFLSFAKHRLSASSLKAIGILLVLGASVATVLQLPHWRSSAAIFRHTLEVSPENFMAHMNLAVALDHNGNLNEAMPHYEQAAMLRPYYPDALNNFGGAKARQGDLKSAEDLFNRALNSQPNFSLARYNLGLLYVSTGRTLQGLLEWVRVLSIDPRSSNAKQSLHALLTRFQSSGCGLFQNISNSAPIYSELRGISPALAPILGDQASVLNEVLKCDS